MPVSSPRPTSSGPGRWLVLGLVAANLLVAGISAWAVHNSLVRHRSQAEVTTRNLAAILEQNLEGQIRQVDLTLVQILEELDRIPSADLRTHLEHHRTRVPLLSDIRLTNAAGQIIAGTGILPPASTNLSGRPYFQALRTSQAGELVISSPLISSLEGSSILVFARRRSAADGGFSGVLYGVVSPEAFNRSLAIVDIGRRGSIAVRNAEHRLLTRHPADPHLDARIGEQTNSPRYLAIVASPQKTGTFRSHSPADGELRTWTVRRVADHPLWLVVGLAESDYLHAWWGDLWKASGTLAGTLLLSLILGAQVLRTTRRQLATQEALSQEKEKFRILTEQTDDVIWSTTPEGQFTYVSPSIFKQRGFTPEELMALPHEATLAGPDPLALIEELRAKVESCAPGTQPFPAQGIEVDHLRKDGTVFPAEIRLTLIWDTEGQLRGLRGITRDISQRKQSQAAMESLIQELTMVLAEVKSLKGMLPICSGCKKIRDDQGYWNQIESYLSQHTDATFTHGMCPDCVEQYFPGRAARRKEEHGQGS